MPLPTFGIWRRKKPEIIKYWCTPVENFETSTEEFYQAIEEELRVKDLPGLDISRVDFAEGGVLSSTRQYLRLRRERLVFDICSARFGSEWFFSCRFAFIPWTLMLWELIVILASLTGIGFGYVTLFGPLWGGIIGGGSVLGMFLVMRNALTLGLKDFDAWMLPVPVLGALYELLRKESYYRYDTQVMYGDVVERIVKTQVERVTAEKGIEQVQFKEALPDVHPLIGEIIRKLRS